MAQLCTNAPPITNSALNGSHLHECFLTHSECTQPTQMKCYPYTLKMHSTNSNQVLPLHTQNALNQLKSRALLHTQNALSQLKWSALLTHSQCIQPTQIKTYNAECGHMHIQCFEIPPKSTNPAFVHLQTRGGLQSSLKLLQGSKSASKNPPELKLAAPTNTKPQDLS